MNKYLPRDGEALPPATTWLMYGGDQRRMVGKHLGPNALGEYLTVVEAEWNGNAGFGTTRVGLAYGIYTVGGVSLDPDGLPVEAQQALNRAALASLQPFRTPGITKVR